MDNVEKIIIERMLNMPLNTIFIIDDFLEFGNYDAVRKGMTRLVNKNKVYRLMDGYFTIPYYMASVGEYSFPSLSAMAEKIAKRHGWIIAPFGELALNYLGLSTQVSAKAEFLSSGPYRQVSYMENTITFKHTSKYLSATSESAQLSLVIQGIIAIGKDRITKNEFIKLQKYCKKWLDVSWSTEAKTAPKWVYQILKNIMEAEDV